MMDQNFVYLLIISATKNSGMNFETKVILTLEKL